MLRVISKSRGELFLSDSFPGPFPTKLYLPGANLRVTQNEECTFIFQEFQGEGFKVRITNISSKKDTQYILMDEEMLTFRVQLHRTNIFNVPDLGQQTFHERSYNLLYVPAFVVEGHLTHDSIITYVDFIVTEEYLKVVGKNHPKLPFFLSRVEKKSPARLTTHNLVAVTEIMFLMDQVFNWAGAASKDERILYYFVSEIITRSISACQKDSDHRTARIKQSDVEIVYRVKEQLVDKGTEISLKDLAEKMHTTIYSLDKNFKIIFGYPPLKFSFEEKMRKVLNLLKNTDHNLKEIATFVGFSGPQSLSRAFKNRFGYSPKRNT